MTRRKRDPDAGLSLLELLVSLAILGMITVTIASIFSSGRRVWDRTATYSEAVDTAVQRSALRDLLEELPTRSPPKALGPFFEGQGRGFAVVAPAVLIEANNPGFVRLSVGQASNSQNAPLRLLAEPIRGTELSTVSDKILSVPLGDIQISYFGRPNSESERDWLAAWPRETALPDLIKIEMWDTEGNALSPLTVQPGMLDHQRYVSPSSLVPPG